MLALPQAVLANHVPGHVEATAADIEALERFAVDGADGVTHYTGLLQRPKGEKPLGAVYYTPPRSVFADIPAQFSSRDKYTTRIKNQGSCGSCWAFSRAKSLEAAMIRAGKATKETIDLAEQDALVNDHSAYGCGGGFMDFGYETAHGVTTESQCPYRTSDRYSCNSNPVVAKATRWAYCGAAGRKPTVAEIQACIMTYGVVSVDVAAGGPDWSNGGDMTNCRSTGINHMVNFDGWSTVNGRVRFDGVNSWGTSWGDDGFFTAEQGCNQIASTADSVMFAYVEGEPGPGPGPEPQPLPLGLPLEVVVQKSQEFVLEPINSKASTRYEWSTGIVGAKIKLQATGSTQVSLKATARDGSVTSQVVKVTVR